MPSTSDQALLRRLCDGDSSALEELMREHGDFLFRVAGRLTGRPEDAEDVVQEAALRLWERPPRWRLAGGRVATYLYRLVRNVASERARRSVRAAAAETEFHEGAPDFAPTPGQDETTGPLVAVDRLLARLPERQREVVVLRVLEEKDTAETARLMGCRPGTVKAHLARALARLRELCDAAPNSAASGAPPRRAFALQGCSGEEFHD